MPETPQVTSPAIKFFLNHSKLVLRIITLVWKVVVFFDIVDYDYHPKTAYTPIKDQPEIELWKKGIHVDVNNTIFNYPMAGAAGCRC